MKAPSAEHNDAIRDNERRGYMKDADIFYLSTDASLLHYILFNVFNVFNLSLFFNYILHILQNLTFILGFVLGLGGKI